MREALRRKKYWPSKDSIYNRLFFSYLHIYRSTHQCEYKKKKKTECLVKDALSITVNNTSLNKVFKINHFKGIIRPANLITILI